MRPRLRFCLQVEVPGETIQRCTIPTSRYCEFLFKFLQKVTSLTIEIVSPCTKATIEIPMFMTNIYDFARVHVSMYSLAAIRSWQTNRKQLLSDRFGKPCKLWRAFVRHDDDIVRRFKKTKKKFWRCELRSRQLKLQPSMFSVHYTIGAYLLFKNVKKNYMLNDWLFTVSFVEKNITLNQIESDCYSNMRVKVWTCISNVESKMGERRFF